MNCPQCLDGNTMVLSNGLGFCFECHFEWNPDELKALPPLKVEPFAMPTVEEVFGPPHGSPERADYEADLALQHDLAGLTGEMEQEAAFEMIALVGQLATLEGGQDVMIVGVPDDDHITAVTASGDTITVGFTDVERVRPIPPFAEPIEPTTQGDHHQEATQ